MFGRRLQGKSNVEVDAWLLEEMAHFCFVGLGKSRQGASLLRHFDDAGWIALNIERIMEGPARSTDCAGVR